MDTASVLLVGLSIEAESALRQAIPETGFEAFGDSAKAERGIARQKPAVAVVSVDGAVDVAFRIVNALAPSGARIIAVGSIKDADLILRCMREGAHEFVLADDRERLVAAVREQIRPLAGSGTVITVFPAKGGVGATTIAVNLAGCWHGESVRTCVVDMNLSLGDVLGFLDLSGGYAISDVLANLGRLDRELLDASILHHRSGIDVLAQCDNLEDAERVEPSLIPSLFGFLRRHYEAIVVDGLRTFDDLALAVLDASDRIVLPCTQEVPAVRDAHRCVRILQRLGASDASKLKLVVNRFQKQALITQQVVTEAIGLPVFATIANNYQAVSRAVQRGVLLQEEVPRAEITRDLELLHEKLAEAPRRSTTDKRSFIGRLFSSRTEHHGAR